MHCHKPRFTLFPYTTLFRSPQSVNQLGGYKIQGREKKDADKMIEDAKLLEKAGVFSIVLECVPYKLAEQITKEVAVRSEEHTSELQSRVDLVCRLLLEKKKI